MTGPANRSASVLIPATAGGPLPYGDARHLAAAQFLVEEAHLLDRADFEGWLGLLAPDIRYRMPVRVTTVKGVDEADVQTMDHFDEDWYSLSKRVERFQTDTAWTEDPRSRTRHHVSNVRTFLLDGDGIDGLDGIDRVDGLDGVDGAVGADAGLVVESAVLLYRSRGDRVGPSVLSAGRIDHLVPNHPVPNHPVPDGGRGGGLRLRARHIDIDDSVLRTQNLAIFL